MIVNNIEILSRDNLRDKLYKQPNFYNSIIIGASELELLGLTSLCKDSHIALFADIVSTDKENSPTLEKVRECIEWGKDKDNLLVSCAAGISRSSSIAYLIECAKSDHPDSSVIILDVNRHRPNQLILCYGSKILDKDVVSPVYELYDNELKKKPNDYNLKYYVHDLKVVQQKIK